MNESQRELWLRLTAFRVDSDEDTLSFRARLARENDWPLAYAERVLVEYRRFLLLATTEGPVTPSDQVDQAWHLHLTYTHSYWLDLCPNVLGRPLHHGPTRGGREEAARFELQYRNTLDKYVAVFNCVPPHDIWPPPWVRFGRDLQFVRVNRSRFLLVEKRLASVLLLMALLALLA